MIRFVSIGAVLLGLGYPALAQDAVIAAIRHNCLAFGDPLTGIGYADDLSPSAAAAKDTLHPYVAPICAAPENYVGEITTPQYVLDLADKVRQQHLADVPHEQAPLSTVPRSRFRLQ